MSFVVNSAELQKHLSLIGGVVPTKSVLPILQNVLFRLSKNELELAATDLDNAMRTSLAVEKLDDEAVDIALPAKLLQDTLKALPEQPITFKVDPETFAVRLTTENGEYELSGANGQDYPALPSPEKTQKLDMPMAILSRAINKTLFAASTDELKPALNGMFFDFKTTGATFVATDAHRLVRYRRLDITVKKDVSFILPQKALKLIGNAAQGSVETITLEYNQSNAFFTFGTTLLVCRLIDARFPDYENVIPKTSSSKAILAKRDLLGSMRRLDIFSNKTTHLGRFSLSSNLLEVYSEDVDFSNRAKENLNSTYDGAKMEIGFNVSLMTDLISNVDTDEVIMELESPSRAAVVLPAEQAQGENILMLLMPVMLSSSF
jgi:DNA polymerase-3 subunit beta